MARLHEVPGCRVLSIDCGKLSTARHGFYQRHPADLPSLGRAVRLDLTVRRLRCLNPSCSRRTFCLPASSLLAPHARRTRRLAKAQQRVGLAINARAGARLLANLSMPASASTLLRLMRAAPLPRVARARAIGVDDWAWRRGRAWGTLVVDLDHHRAIDLLPDRNSATFEAWLASHTDLEIVARDRSTGDPRAAQAVVPRAQQVADRWPLLLNARQMLQRWLVGAHARLRALPVPSGSAASAPDYARDNVFPRSHTDQAAAQEAQRWRAVRHAQVQRRRAAGESIMAIVRAIPLAPATVRRYASTERAPERGGQRIGSSQLWQGHGVLLRLRLRRFLCLNAACPRRTFSENVEPVVRSHARRSERLRDLQRHLGLALGGAPAARLARRLAMPVSGDTLLRLVRAAPVPDRPEPRVVGIDEWAWRRGRSYGTMIVDFERHIVIDLLPDRDAISVAGWLRAHPGIEIVARDRAEIFAEGVRAGAPQAQQVLDRFHLLCNLGLALHAIVARHHAAVVITQARDGGVQAPMVFRMVPNELAPVRRAVSTTVRMAASPSAAHMAR